MPNAEFQTKHFRIGHADIQIGSSDETLLAMSAVWLSEFEVEAAGAAEDAIRVSLIGYEQDEAIPFRIPAQAELTFENDFSRYYRHEGLWIVDFHELGLMTVNRSAYEIIGHAYSNSCRESIWRFEDFMHPLLELLRQKGLYPHHAAAVSLDGNGLLLAGKSGRGKSTLSADLLDRGFDFMADDRCFLRAEADGGVEMIGFYEPFKVFASNIAHIPALRSIEGLSAEERVKNRLDMRLYYPRQFKRTSRLNAILFPYWAPGEASRLEPMAPGEALVELLPLTLVCFDAVSAAAHFDFTGRLVSCLPSAKLMLGGDRENWYKLALDFLAQNRRL
ncbi:hypothetical protein BG53_01870 [Paenibacillus darwinianus]|uniref:Aldolase n=1 Tax=Paenibacillus darwinianus TaxID=1380763 RepID=A0A9W5S0H2_9BACL|nr:hypothetical protein [Paenibacillus darwinianus]EXX87533.1 hypothetical protein BG52_03895 [Paenibacillus darwinianus]EXX88496.1 hypothetical protein BG53_01870 [Paenibacillus darwinianus]EXX88706.1 hypothetical protein CH50_02920 [Paenibacillus darwinianus]